LLGEFQTTLDCSTWCVWGSAAAAVLVQPVKPAQSVAEINSE